MARALINATPEQKTLRDVERIKVLRIALAKAEDGSARKESLQAELDRRMESVNKMRETLAELDG